MNAMPASVDEYIAGFPPDIQDVLRSVRATVRSAAPHAEERISYRMPALFQQGVVVYFAAFKHHIGLFPPVEDAAVRAVVARYAGPKGNLQFAYTEPIPHELIARVVRARLMANQAKAAARHPATSRTLLRFSGALERDPAIDVWLDAQASPLGSIARTWFAQMRQCGTDVRELMHDGCPTACVGDAPFAYVNAFKAHVNVGFFHGAALADPQGLLEGSGKHMRHVKVKPGKVLDGATLEALINAAYRDIVARLEAAE
jgi:uncharacterized protein YdhG (YjbR/CyaY superfamily)